MPNEKSGLGVGGPPRQGKPKTEAERRKEHGGPTPPRGTGVRKKSGDDFGFIYHEDEIKPDGRKSEGEE